VESNRAMFVIEPNVEAYWLVIKLV